MLPSRFTDECNSAVRPRLFPEPAHSCIVSKLFGIPHEIHAVVASAGARNRNLGESVAVGQDLSINIWPSQLPGTSMDGVSTLASWKYGSAFCNHGHLHAIGDIGEPDGEADEAVWCCAALFNRQRVFNEVMRGIPFILGGQDVVRSNPRRRQSRRLSRAGSVYRSQTGTRMPCSTSSSATRLTNASPNTADKKRNTSEMASVVPRTILNSLDGRWVGFDEFRLQRGIFGHIVPRFGVQVAVLEHTPASLPEQKKNKPQRHPVRSHGMEDDVVAMRASVLEGIPDELRHIPATMNLLTMRQIDAKF